jgi:pyruvate kinase
MKMKQMAIILSLLGLSALLTPVARAVEANDVSNILVAAQNATTPTEHEAIAKYYEDTVKAMRAKLQEQQQLLEHYQDKSYLYARQAQDLQAHADALARRYEQAVKTNTQEVTLHRQMALQAEENSRPAIEMKKLTAIQPHHNRFTAE